MAVGTKDAQTPHGIRQVDEKTAAKFTVLSEQVQGIINEHCSDARVDRVEPTLSPSARGLTVLYYAFSNGEEVAQVTVVVPPEGKPEVEVAGVGRGMACITPDVAVIIAAAIKAKI